MALERPVGELKVYIPVFREDGCCHSDKMTEFSAIASGAVVFS